MQDASWKKLGSTVPRFLTKNVDLIIISQPSEVR